jgi:hypothetical protein
MMTQVLVALSAAALSLPAIGQQASVDREKPMDNVCAPVQVGGVFPRLTVRSDGVGGRSETGSGRAREV